MATSTTTILDLNDDCLSAIFKRISGLKTKRNFSMACVRFAKIYCNHYVHQLICEGCDEHFFDSCLAIRFAHLIGSDIFPMKDIRSIKLDDMFEPFFTKKFFSMLKRDHPNIEIAELDGFKDEHLQNMMPLTNLKHLHLNSSLGTGDYIHQLRNLEELIIKTAQNFESKHLVSIFQQNKLQKLVLRSCPLVFSAIHPIDMFQNLNYLRELEGNWLELKGCQLIGDLPCLKVLIINDFKTFQCGSCRRIERGDATVPISEQNYGICECGVYDAWMLFKKLRKRNILEKFVFIGSRITTRDLTFITKLTSLKTLYMGVENVPLYMSIAMFNSLRELEEIDMGYSWKLPTEALDFLQKCQKLRYINFRNSQGFCENFILEAIEVLKRRSVPPVEPVRLEFTNPDFDTIFLEDERVKAASSILKIEYFKTSKMINRLYNSIYYI